MDREDNLRPYYQLSHSTIVQSPYAPTKHLPSFSGNSNEPLDYGRQMGNGYSAAEGQFSNNSQGMDELKYGNPVSNNRGYNQMYSNQYSESSRETEGAPLSKSTVLDTKYPGDSKKGDIYFYPQKYANTSTNKGETNNAEQSFQTSLRNEGLSNDFNSQRKDYHNFSLQFSPRKSKKPSDQPATSRQNVGESRYPTDRNNLESYKKMQIDSPHGNNQEPNFMKFSVHNIPTSTASNIQSPNSSLEHHKNLIKRQFSSGGLNSLLKGNLISPSSAPDTTFFSSQLKNKEMNFTKEDFAVIKKLGKGKYGDVFLTQHKHSRIVCALKIISKDVIMKEEGGVNQFIREATIQTYLSNPYIIQMWGIFCDAQNMYLIQEPALDGQLFKYMRQRKYIEEPQAAGLIKQLCIGVQYLQSQKIIHRDLKPQNILLHDGKLKICDFGWAVYNEDSFRETFCGTPLYLSPDVLVGNQYNDKVDNWAIGIITYQMLYGKIPFKITTQRELQKILNEQIQFPQNVQVSDTAKDFILALLDRNADTRIDIEEVLSHPFLTGVN